MSPASQRNQPQAAIRLGNPVPRFSSDAGFLLWRQAERRLGVCRRLAAAMPDCHDPDRVWHEMFEMVAARATAIVCGYKDGIDHDRLRRDPLMKAAVGRHPQSGAPLASQSTIYRLVAVALLDQFGTSVKSGRIEILDIDDTFCAAHGGAAIGVLERAHDERGFP